VSTICNLLHNRLMKVILGVNRDALGLRSMLSTFLRVGLHDLPGFHPFCFTWLGAVLDSNYPDADKYELAGLVLLFLQDAAGLMQRGAEQKLVIAPLYVTVLVRFLLLHEMCEKAGIEPKKRGWAFNSEPFAFPTFHPTIIALRLLLGTPKDTLILPVFLVIPPAALQQNQQPNTRAVALRLFNHHRHWLFSPSIESLLPTHRIELLRAVGDPFDLTTPPSFAGLSGAPECDLDGVCLFPKVMGLLLALASSDVWRDYLHPTNFASCDAVMAGEDHVRETIQYFSNWSNTLKGPGDSKFCGLMLGVNRLKQLRCHSAVKLILLSLWSTPIIPLYDQEVWGWVERQTLELFSARGEEHLGIFVSQIKKAYGRAMVDLMTKLKRSEDENDLPDAGSPFRVDRVGRRVRTKDPRSLGPFGCNFYTMCQLRRLYRLIGHDPTSGPPTGARRERSPPHPLVGDHSVVGFPRPESDGTEWNVDQTTALDGHTVFTKQLDPTNPIRDPTNDLAVFSRKGSSLAKEKREQAEHAEVAAQTRLLLTKPQRR